MSFQLDEQVDQSAHKTERPKVLKYARPTPPSFENVQQESEYKKNRLVLACKVLVAEGYEWCGTELSFRDPIKQDSLWTVPAGLALSSVGQDDLIQVDFDGNVVTKGKAGANYDIHTLALHVAIYSGRLDVHAIIQSNGNHIQPFSMLRKPLSIIVQDSCTFYKSCNVVPLSVCLHAAADPKAVQDALGDGKALIIANKGGLVVNPTIEGCVGLIFRLEGVTEGQLLAEAAVRGRGGQLMLIGEDEAEVGSLVSRP